MGNVVCPKCGRETFDSSLYCKYKDCNALLGSSFKSSDGNKESPNEYKKCPYCEYKNELIEVNCRKCGSRLNKSSRICGKCGKEYYSDSVCKCSENVNSQGLNKEKQGNVTDESPHSSSRLPRLICQSNQAIIFEIKDKDVIGRGKGGLDTTCLNNDFISGRHASFSCENGAWFICDIGTMGEGSTNGTKVNFRKITPNEKVEIKNGDKIILANELFVFETQ